MVNMLDRAAYDAAYYAANKEKILARKAAYRAANKEKVAARKAAYYVANKEKVATSKAVYYAANKEKVRVKGAAYYAANRKKVLTRKVAYRAANPDKLSAHDQRRRARVCGAPVVESINTAKLCERDGWLCHLCGEKIDRRLIFPDPMSPTGDHLVPLSAGGDHSYQNMAAAHLRCNQKRGVLGPAQLRLFG